jgi:hypothetical protein
MYSISMSIYRTQKRREKGIYCQDNLVYNVLQNSQVIEINLKYSLKSSNTLSSNKIHPAPPGWFREGQGINP